MGRIGKVREGLGRIRKVWEGLGGFGRVWNGLGRFGRVWECQKCVAVTKNTYLVGVGKVWGGLNGFGRFRESWEGFGRVWECQNCLTVIETSCLGEFGRIVADLSNNIITPTPAQAFFSPRCLPRSLRRRDSNADRCSHQPTERARPKGGGAPQGSKSRVFSLKPALAEQG